jgi:anti-sigma regulatory factor (Ser/Thr protein kinase)
MPEAFPAALVLRVPTDLAYVRAGRKVVEGLLELQGWSEDDVDQAGLVVTELLQNAIEHGSRADGTEHAEVLLRLDARCLVLETRDPGTGRNPSDLLQHDVTRPVPIDAERGRGLYLIHRLSSRFERAALPAGGCLVRVQVECGAE